MRAVDSVILKTNGNYNNKEVANGVAYTVNVSIDDVTSINRTATVVAAPYNSNLNSGDEVIVHHNIMRENIHTSGVKTKGFFNIVDNFYHCPVSEVIMKKNNEGHWETLLDFVFIKPIKEENIELGFGMTLAPRARKGMKELRATLAITNKGLKGVSVGDTVIFSKNSEHEFIIDGEVLFKCEVQDILGKEE